MARHGYGQHHRYGRRREEHAPHVARQGGNGGHRPQAAQRRRQGQAIHAEGQRQANHAQSDHQPQAGAGDGIGNARLGHGQACGHQQNKRHQRHAPVDEHAVDRAAKGEAGAPGPPHAHDVAADGGGQALIEELAHDHGQHGVAIGKGLGQRLGNDPPAKRLGEPHGRQHDPGGRQAARIDVTQRRHKLIELDAAQYQPDEQGRGGELEQERDHGALGWWLVGPKGPNSAVLTRQ